MKFFVCFSCCIDILQAPCGICVTSEYPVGKSDLVYSPLKLLHVPFMQAAHSSGFASKLPTTPFDETLCKIIITIVSHVTRTNEWFKEQKDEPSTVTCPSNLRWDSVLLSGMNADADQETSSDWWVLFVFCFLRCQDCPLRECVLH